MIRLSRRTIIVVALAGILSLFIFGGTIHAAQTVPTDAPCQLQTGNPFFGFPHWWQYLKGHEVQNSVTGGQCLPTLTGINDIWAILLAVINMLLRLAGLVAVFSVIFSGAQYVFAGGNPEKAASARWRLYNSLIGLAIVSVATAVVAFIGKYIT